MSPDVGCNIVSGSGAVILSTTITLGSTPNDTAANDTTLTPFGGVREIGWNDTELYSYLLSYCEASGDACAGFGLSDQVYYTLSRFGDPKIPETNRRLGYCVEKKKRTGWVAPEDIDGYRDDQIAQSQRDREDAIQDLNNR